LQRGKPGTLPGFPSLTIGPQRGRKSMSKLIFSHHLQPEYILGKDLNLLPFELFAHVKAGRLHPLDKDTGQPIPRPDILKIKKRLEEIEQEIKVLPLAYGKLQTGKVYPVTHKQPQIVKVIFKGSPEQVEKQLDEWDKKSQQEKEEEMWKKQLDERAEKLQEEQGSLNEKLKAITDINDWTTYDPPKEPKHLITHLPIDLMKAFDILQNARFHNDEIRILNIETPLDSSAAPDNIPPKAPAPAEESAPALEPQKETQVPPDTFLENLQITYLDDATVKILYRGKRTNVTCESMGFRDCSTEEWKTFREILQSTAHVYELGQAYSYDKTTRQKKRMKDYDNKLKRLNEINKKLIDYLSPHYPVIFPLKYKLYERRHDKRSGTYMFKFQIPSEKPSYKTKDQALKRLEILIKKKAEAETINDACLEALESGASKEEISEITINMDMTLPKWGADIDKEDLENDFDLANNSDIEP